MEAPLDKNIFDFIKSQTAFTLATCSDNTPYCASCFYAFMEDTQTLIFKSDKQTKHMVEAGNNPSVAGTILPDKFMSGKVKGLQFSGRYFRPDKQNIEKTKAAYYKKYPFAIGIPGEFGFIDILHIKYTDYTLGFGKKLNWDKKVIPPF